MPFLQRLRLQRQHWPTWARVVGSGWVLSPVLAFALVLGAFFAYGAYTRSQPTNYSRGGDFLIPADGAKAGGTHKVGDKAEKAAGATGHRDKKNAPKAATVKAGATGGTTQGSTVGQPAGAHSGESSAGSTTRKPSGEPATTGPVLPRVGTYSIAVSGSEHVKFGPFSACTNTFPGRSQLVVSKATGEPAGSYNFDQRFYPSSPNKHDERHIFRYTDSGVFTSYEQATVTCGGVKQSSSVSYSPLQQRVPATLQVGAGWHVHGGDGKRTEDGSAQVVRTEQVVVGGTSYTTYVIDSHVSMSGDESGSRDRRLWWSPDFGMALKWHESLSGQRSGATYSEDVTCTVVRTP
jgi:hypothetical protein